MNRKKEYIIEYVSKPLAKHLYNELDIRTYQNGKLIFPKKETSLPEYSEFIKSAPHENSFQVEKASHLTEADDLELSFDKESNYDFNTEIEAANVINEVSFKTVMNDESSSEAEHFADLFSEDVERHVNHEPLNDTYVSPTLSTKKTRKEKKEEKHRAKLEKKLGYKNLESSLLSNYEEAIEKENYKKKIIKDKVKKERLRPAKRLSLFEEVLDEDEILDQKLEDMINQDGYYSVVPPLDINRDSVDFGKAKKKVKVSYIIATILLTLICICVTIYEISTLF